MLGTEGSRQFYLHRLRGRKGVVQAGTLAGQRLVPLVGLIRYEYRLGLAMRPEGDRFSGRAVTPEPGKDARQPRPYLGQRVHRDRRGISHTHGVPKLRPV